MRKYLECKDGKSNKFWRVETEGKVVTITFGKIGTDGHIQIKNYSTAEEAEKEATKYMNGKMKKGYQEVDEPEGMKKETPKAMKVVVKEKEVKIPKTVKDTGEDKLWHHEDYYGYHYYPEDVNFSIDYLDEDKPAKKQAKPVKQREEKLLWDTDGQDSYERVLEDKRELEEDQADEEDYARSRLSYGAKTLESFKEYYEKYKKLRGAGAANEEIGYRLKNLFKRSSSKIDFETIKIIKFILEQGNFITSISKDRIGTTILQNFYNYYIENPNPEEIESFFTSYFEEVYQKEVKEYQKVIEDVVKHFEDKEYQSNYFEKYLVNFYPETCYGFNFYAYSEYFELRPIQFGYDSDSWAGYKGEDTDGIEEKIAHIYIKKYLTPILEELNQQGLFKKIPRAKLKISLYNRNNNHAEDSILLYVDGNTDTIDEKKKEYQLLKDKVNNANLEEVHVEELEQVIGELIEGCYLEKELNEALIILKKYLYSTDGVFIEKATKLLDYYSDISNEWKYEYGMNQYHNLKYYDAYSSMNYLGNIKGYEPAKEKAKEWLEEAKERAKQYGAKDTSSKRVVSYDDSDMKLETDHLIARADYEGEIFIRFKEESEDSYSEVLDFLNNLLRKGYSNDFDGHSIYVRFIDKPVFIKQLKSFPNTSCHALFAKAVQYPNLREKVKEYAELALVMYNWYLDLNGDEDNTVTGTFAACALAFCEEQYIHLAGLYGRKSDDEHQYIQLDVVLALIKEYGEIPEVSKAIFDLNISNGQDGPLKITPGFSSAENLAAIMEYIQTGVHYQRHMDSYVTRYVERLLGSKVKSNLKKLKSFADAAETPEEKNIFIDFYNFYKGYATSYHEEDYGEDIKGVVEEKEVVIEEYNENPPLIMATSEARERGLLKGLIVEYDFKEKYDFKRPVIFSPSAITNPYYYDYIKQQWSAVLKANMPVGSCSRIRLFGKNNEWVFIDEGAIYDMGVILFNGERPVVLYGMMNVAAVASRYFKRPFKTQKEAETIRQQYLIDPNGKRPTLNLEEKELEIQIDIARDHFDNKRYYAAKTMLEELQKSTYSHFANAALLLRAKLAGVELNKSLEMELYKELLEKLPEYSDYWNTMI